MNDVNNYKVIKSGIWFTASNFLMKSIGFITTPIFTRIMSKTEYGDFNNFQTWLMILLYVTSLDLEASLIRACHEFKDDIERYVFSIIALSMFSTGIWWLIFTIFEEYFTKTLLINPAYINGMFLYLLFCPAINIFQNAERYKYKYKWTVLTSLTISVGASLLSVGFVFLFQDKLFGRITGFIIPTILIGGAIVIYYLLKVKRIKFSYWKYALPITLPYIPHLLSMYLLSNMDRVMIRSFCGPEYVALYSLAYTCGMLITILVTSINNAFSPWLAENLSKKNYQSIHKISVPYVLMFSYAAFISVLFTPEILYILGGTSYMEAKYVMPPVAAGCLLQFIYCMYVNIEQYEKKTIGMAFASLIAVLVNFVLNLIFIKKFGYVAAAYTTFVGYFILLLLHMFLVKKIGFSHVYDNRKILLIGCITSLCIFLCNFLLDKMFIRYIVLFIFLLVGIWMIFKYRNKLKHIIHK